LGLSAKHGRPTGLQRTCGLTLPVERLVKSLPGQKRKLPVPSRRPSRTHRETKGGKNNNGFPTKKKPRVAHWLQKGVEPLLV